MSEVIVGVAAVGLVLAMLAWRIHANRATAPPEPPQPDGGERERSERDSRRSAKRSDGGEPNEVRRSSSDSLRSSDGGHLPENPTTEAGSETEAKSAGLTRWLTTVDHKDIGIMYIVFGAVAGLWGGMDAMMIRTELLTPPADVWTEGTYNALFTTHGITMLILFVTPVFFGMANYFLPILIGADDLAFPRLNALGFWLLPPALILIRGGLVVNLFAKFLGVWVPVEAIEFLFSIKPPELGWYMYAPLSLQSPNPQIDFFLLGLHLSGIATVLASINFIVTVFAERGKEVSWADLDLFTWTLVTTAGIALFAFSLLGSAIVMLLLDRNFGTTFFALEGGGPILWQHIFWFWGHPEVYIIVLPGFGLMSTILPKFAGRTLFGRKYVIYSTFAIGVLSFGVWAHHMFSTGIDPRIRASFMAVSLAIAIPSAIKEFNWITTIWEGRVRLTAPMIFCVGGLSTFVIGGITGVFLASIPVDLLYHDTYYVVGHFHMILMGIIPFMMMAASYYWFPILTERMYDQPLARFQAVLMVVGVIVTFGAMLITGALGLPRRYASYPAEFAPLMEITTIGAYVIGISVLLWLWNMLKSYFWGSRITEADVWDLKEVGQFTREWQHFEEQLRERYAADGSGERERSEPERRRATPDGSEGDG